MPTKDLIWKQKEGHGTSRKKKKKKPKLFMSTVVTAGDALVSDKTITSGDSFLTLTLKLQTAKAQVNPRQFQDSSFMMVEVAQIGSPP
jgi:hypothetical protein